MLFLFLLIAAGCRAQARARRNAQPPPIVAGQEAASPKASAPLTRVPVTEPTYEKETASTAARKAVERDASPPKKQPTAGTTPKARVYVVKAGDTMEKIARMHRTSVQAIKEENNLKNYNLKPGQQLRVGTQKTKTPNEV
jgi:LysM repeat protein